MDTHNNSFLLKKFSEYKDKTNVCSDEDKDSPQAWLFIVFDYLNISGQKYDQFLEKVCWIQRQDEWVQW